MMNRYEGNCRYKDALEESSVVVSVSSDTMSAEEERRKSEFRDALEDLINIHSMENASDTPDFILANYLMTCLVAYDETTKARDQWYSVHLTPGNSRFLEEEDERKHS
jgi:hypothetical protein